MRSFLLGAATLAVLLATAMGTDAGTWRVGRAQTDCPGNCNFFDGANTGDGIAQAMTNVSVMAGDTVRVWPGSLPGGYQIRFAIKSGVVLVSEAGPDSTLICGGAGFEPAISFVATSPSTVVDGFTIRWDATQTGLGGAVGSFAGSGTLKNCIIRDCLAGTGAGVYLQSCDLVVENNLFIGNRTIGGAGCIAISGGNPTIRNNTFYDSTAPFGTSGSVLFAFGASYTFDRNLVVGSNGAPAVFCGGTNTPTITCNVFWDNELGPFGGGCVDSSGTSGNVTADPQFCEPNPSTLGGTCNAILPAGGALNQEFSFGVCDQSIALTTPCGVIGYTSLKGNSSTCCYPTPVATLEAASFGRIKSFYLRR